MLTEQSDPYEFWQLVKSERAVVAFFYSDACAVCHTLKPKAGHLFRERFPEIKRTAVNVGRIPELAAQNTVFTAPVMIVFFDGHEFLRRAGSFSLSELHAQISRPYRFMFS